MGETGDLRRTINNNGSTIKTKRVKEPVVEHFNLEGHSWDDMTEVVIDHNSNGRMQTERARSFECID